MKIERIVTVFEKKEDGKFIKELNADNVNVSVLEKLYQSYDDDPNFYRPYHIEQIHYNELIKYVEELKNYPFSNYDLYIEAVQV
jgi:nuclear transport factor 2 (NTF2) superfamily protein